MTAGARDQRAEADSGAPVDRAELRRRVRALWMRGAQMAREQLFEADPLAHCGLDARPEERVVRARWAGGAWVEDVARLKVAAEPFAEGSMRRCWHCKKMSSRCTLRHRRTGSRHAEWRYQRNYVLKTYLPRKARGGGERLRRMLETDVQTQATAKADADAYNRRLRGLLAAGGFDRRAPQPMALKCVDMLEASLVTFVDRPGRPAFFMEAFVAGDFVKHNGNAGYVAHPDGRRVRQTPQAFSHFTFCASRGARMVVDVQGVGDLFTDPQIHTHDGEGFGVGNGGARGVALFFATHRCNRICRAMGLPRFRTRGDARGSTTYGRALGALAEALAGAEGADLRCLPCATASRIPRAPLAPPDADATLFAEAHAALGLMLAGGDEALARPSPAAAAFHLSAAALGGNMQALGALEEARDAWDARAAALAARRVLDGRAAARNSAVALAAAGLLALALYNVGLVLGRRAK